MTHQLQILVQRLHKSNVRDPVCVFPQIPLGVVESPDLDFITGEFACSSGVCSSRGKH